MKLKYRGVAYPFNPTEVIVTEGKVGGRYRGVPWHYRIPQVVAQITEPSVDLKYRGVSYNKGAVKFSNIATESKATLATHPEILPKEKSVSKTQQMKAK